MKEINMKVVSYCDIPEEIVESHHRLRESSNDCYIPYVLPHSESNDEDLDIWLREEYPELIGTGFLIEIDY